MLDFIGFTPLIIFLSAFQTITGVGILVLGTPIMLLLELEIVEVMILLLPLSILNSFINIVYLKYKSKNNQINRNIKNFFFLICLPGIFLGLIILKLLNEYLNFNLLVSLTIWLFLFFNFFKKKNVNISNIFKKYLIFITGIIHGLTNSGGSLLSMLVVNEYKKSLDYIRYQIIFFYFFLALFHFISIIIIFDSVFFASLEISYLLSLIIGIIIGNVLLKKININRLRNIIFTLAFISSIFLISQA